MPRRQYDKLPMCGGALRIYNQDADADHQVSTSAANGFAHVKLNDAAVYVVFSIVMPCAACMAQRPLKPF